MDLSDDQVQRRAEADRREVDPPIDVEAAMWSKAGQVDWWERTPGMVGSGTRCRRPSTVDQSCRSSSCESIVGIVGPASDRPISLRIQPAVRRVAGTLST